MPWKEHPSHRCEYCGHKIGRTIKIEWEGKTLSNKRKTCHRCGKRGCLNCMTGNPDTGILYHKECQK